MRAIGRGDFDHRQHVADRIEAGAAVFVRHFDAHQAERAHLLDRLERKFAALVEFGGDRRDALLREIAGDGLDRQLVFGETEIHDLPRLGSGGTAFTPPLRGEAGRGMVLLRARH